VTFLSKLYYCLKFCNMNRILLFLVLLFVVSACQESEMKGLPLEKEPIQTFSISTTRDTLITGNKGTQILFRSGGLLNSSGQVVDGRADVRLQEFYTIQDFINSGLVTQTTDDKPLISSGMINLEVWQGDKSLMANPNKPYLLKFKNANPAAELFIGQKDENNLIKWELDSAKAQPIIQITEKIEKGEFGTEKVVRTVDTLGFTNRLDGTITYITGFTAIEKAVGDSSTNIDNQEVTTGFNFFIPKGFGFLNCDAFYRQETIEFKVQSPSNKFVVQIIIDEKNSILSPLYCEEGLCLFKLPEDLPISVYTYHMEAETWLFDLKKANSNDSLIILNPKKSTPDDMIKVISTLK
jgi:hypothetical protein